MRVLMAAGGTGGHLIPAIRIAEAIKHHREDAEFMFVGSDRGFEERVTTRRGYAYVGLPARGFIRGQVWKNLTGLWYNGRALRDAGKTVRRFAPHAAVGCGGYASYFPIRAARSRRIPYILQEQNRIPGLATRWLAAGAETTFVAFDQTRRHLPKARRTEVVGNPIDPRLASMSRSEARRAWTLGDDETVILVTGGSGGARSINENLRRGLAGPCPAPPVTVLWQTGHHHDQDAVTVADGWHVRPFEFTDAMTEAFVAADVIVARSGALTISEIAAAGKPAVLVPFPHATADHQTHNARVLADAGGAVVVADRELSSVSLLTRACELLQDAQLLHKMGEASRSVACPDAAGRVAEYVISVAEQSMKRSHPQ